MNNTFQKLTPTDKVDLLVYEDAFKYIFENDDIKNVAISGPYSAGKSSLLESYKKNCKDKKFLHISLAHFRVEPEKEKSIEENGEDKNIEAVLEGKILNQLIQQIDANNIPQTNFHVKRKVSAFKCFGAALLIVVFAVCFLATAKFATFSSWIEEFHNYNIYNFLKYLIDPIARFVYAVGVVGISIFGIFELIKTQKNKGIFRKLSVQGNEIEIFSDAEDSYFDKYLNEVLYLFENTNADVIVFEDIDRFDIGTVFERLHEVNRLANARMKKDGKTLRFFYLLRDDIFINKDRTKFFDFIMPVIPVVDSSNAFNKLKSYLEEGNVYNLFDERFLRGISLYIDDLRILKNICNEFMIYFKKLNKIELSPNKMMGIIVYKNIFPRDFSELQLNKGFVWTLFSKKNMFIEEEIKAVTEEIESYEHQIELCEKEHLNSNDEVDLAYSQKLSAARNTYYSRREQEVQKIQDEIRERKQAIEDKKNNRVAEFHKIIQNLKTKRDQLSESALCEIITRDNIDVIFHTTDTDELGKEICFNDVKGNEYFDLLKYLLRNGYIDESYNDYMSFFYDNSLTVNDKMFLRSITDRKAKKYDYPIDNVALVFSNLNPVDFTQEETKNFALFYEILNNTGRSNYLEKFVSQLKSSDCFDFLYQYLETGKNTDEYINKLATGWPEFVSVILKNEKYTEQQIHQFCVCFVSYLSNEMMAEINLDSCLLNYISNTASFLDIENPDVESIVRNFEMLNVKFVGINPQQADTELLRQVYIHNMYVINLQNIKMWLQLYYMISIIPETEGKILSIVFNKEEEPLSRYVKENLDGYLEIIANEDIPNSDDEDVVLYVLNEEVEIEHKQSYIERMTYKLSELNKIDSVELRIDIVKLRKMIFSLDNLLSYYRDNGLDGVLIEFINNNEEVLVYNETESELLGKFWQDILSCNDLTDEKYLEILDAIGYECDVFTEAELSVSKVDSLIGRKWILMNEENLIFIRQTYPEATIKYAQTYLSEYIELSSNGLADVNEISEMLELPIEDQKKIELLNTIPGESVSVVNKNISSQVFRYIIENNYDSSDSPALFEDYSRYDNEVKKCILKIALSDFAAIKTAHEKVDFNLLDLILRSDEIAMASRKELMLLVMDRIFQIRCKEYLTILGFDEIAKIFESNRRPKISITPENRKILEAMKNNHFIQDYNEDAEREVFKVTRIEERENSLPSHLL